MDNKFPEVPIEIIWRDPAELKLYENNPRKHGEDNINAIMQSFKDNGILLPVLIDAGDVVVKGAGCVIAALRMNLSKIPCVQETHLTDEQARAYRLVDNRTTELSSWDYSLQAEEIAALIGIDLSAFKFPDFTEDLDVRDEDFLQDTEIVHERTTKPVICPNCGHEFTP